MTFPLDKEMRDIMKRMKEREKRANVDARRGDEMRRRAEDAWVTPEGIECYTMFFAMPGWERLPDTVKEMLPHGHYNGYVRLVRPLFRTKGYNDLLTYVPVHGGITFSAVDSEGCKTYGFDCAHAGDEVTRWTREAVMRETARLAFALVVAARFEDAFLRRAAPGRGKSRKWKARRRAKQWKARARVVTRYHQALAQQAGIRFRLTDNFGAMLRVLGGTI